ncbi:MAG: bifunctional [glutamate--ammonia ligase]-adenylyl-L-tyrosine phosphorylase/[glutamate--ammonia-ligase] adenylyltransferase [Rhodocyclaceae bacterium]|nr:bifunctional [glutamate--ammonia ligase]-adenylyl-L-tyrosine phosphorylase/[glutamate--ammonia-ligase] adenylyltransferase [Rhodocyclaceae bacterium]
MPLIDDILSQSRYLHRLTQRRPELATKMVADLHEPVTGTEIAAWMTGQTVTEDNLKSVLRQLKQTVISRVAARDLAGLAPLAEVTEAMTHLAECALATAQGVLLAALQERYGIPSSATGARQELIVVGMGKLGGRELNVSSDIDLIFVYGEDGETVPEQNNSSCRSISNSEFFTRLGRALINAIADVTEDGQVFRVDMRLRPNGDSGPLVCSLDMLENYFVVQGREWERYAWIKARVLNERKAAHEALDAVRRPFVFRKYLDFGAINAMRDLHAQIRREVAKKDMVDNIKLGPGGIREVEFIAQVFQLIRGGRERNLQVKPTLAVLRLLTTQGILPQATVDELTAAYEFMRRLEHRLQYLDDAQTHSLPVTDVDRAIIARTMGFASFDALVSELDDHRSNVSRHFDSVFAAPEDDTPKLHGLWHEGESSDGIEDFQRLGYRDPASSMRRLATLHSGARYQQMTTAIKERFDVLVPRLIQAAARAPNPDETLVRSLDLLESISRRAAYLALLQQYPHALERLAALVSSSKWAADYLQRHPILLDELLDHRTLQSTIVPDAFLSELNDKLDDAEPDVERQMDVMREQHHAQVFRLLVQDLAGNLTVETLADGLSILADGMLQVALQRVWRKLPKRDGDSPRFAIISYGKLGGKELGYASDLDLVFLYDDTTADAGEIYSRLATRLNTWLSAQTSAGQLFETDLRLRPNGDSGLMVSSLDAFRRYQLESAWIWEHQALTRARFSAGDPAVGAEFERIRTDVLCQPRDLSQLRAEVLEMRKKMFDAHGTRRNSSNGDEGGAMFNLKHDRGGLVDVEFIVQYLVLGYSHRFSALTANLGNLALLKIAAQLELIPLEIAEDVRNAYRDFRRMQHQLRLNGTSVQVPMHEVEVRATAVRTLWAAVFDSQQISD